MVVEVSTCLFKVVVRLGAFPEVALHAVVSEAAGLGFLVSFGFLFFPIPYFNIF